MPAGGWRARRAAWRRGSFLTQWAYDAADRPTAITYPGGNAGQAGERVVTTYNNQGLPQTLTSTTVGDTYVQNATYDESGRVLYRYLGPAGATQLQNRYNYFPWTTEKGNGRLRGIQDGPTAGSVDALVDLFYGNWEAPNHPPGYDAAGNLLRLEDWRADAGGQNILQAATFGYDALNRLTSAYTAGGTIASYSESYGYNGIGNLTSKNGVAYAYQDTNQKHALTHIGGVQQYWYDANGNMTTRVEDGVTYTQAWDAENRLTSVTTSSGQTTTFTYDADGQRIRRIDASGTTVTIGNYYEYAVVVSAPPTTTPPTPAPSTPTPTATATVTPTPTGSAPPPQTPTRTPTATTGAPPNTHTPTPTAAPAPPTTASFQQGVNSYSGNAVTWFDASGAGYNGDGNMLVGANDQYKGLLRFDLSSIPANANVDGATLELYYQEKLQTPSLEVGVHQVLKDWVDSQATWTYRKANTAWSGGGMVAGSDYATTAAASVALAAPGSIAFSITGLAQNWVTNPAQNYGLVLRQKTAGGYVSARFCTELASGSFWPCSNAAWRPKLTITYRASGGPAPLTATPTATATRTPTATTGAAPLTTTPTATPTVTRTPTATATSGGGSGPFTATVPAGHQRLQR